MSTYTKEDLNILYTKDSITFPWFISSFIVNISVILILVIISIFFLSLKSST